MNLASLLDDAVRRFPDRIAIVGGGERLTYAELGRRIDRRAHALVALGVGRGDNVALTCPNVPQFTVAYFAILKAGAAVVPLNILLKAGEIAYHLRDSEAVAYLCHDGSDELPTGREGRAAFDQVETCHEFVRLDESGGTAQSGSDEPFDTVATDEDDTAVILYTSGTTGRPKGAELRHRNMRDNALLGRQLFQADAERPDTYLCVLPLFHSFGQTFMQNGAFAFGGTVVMLPRFDAETVLDVIPRERVTLFAGVPTMYWGLLGASDARGDESPDGLDLRVAIAGGSALAVAVHERFEQRFGVTILDGYGLSETSPAASFAPWGEAIRAGSIGKPVPGVSMKLIRDDWTDVALGEIGEIAIKGHNVMKGYYGRIEATAEVMRDGWFRSGDLARVDDDGFFYIVDRSKDLIIRGGFNVYPREVEEVLMTHPDVSLAAVVGVPHDMHGEEIKAFIILRPGARLTEGELVRWTKERVAAYKYPRAIAFVDALPMTATGKILKRELV